MNNLFKTILNNKKMKLKLSSMLLIGLALFTIGGIFASGFILRKQYDSRNTSDPYWYYRKLTNEPFKHLIIEQVPLKSDTSNKNNKDISAIFGSITFEGGSTYSVISSPIDYVYRRNNDYVDTIMCKIIGYTLTILVPSHETSYFDDNRRVYFDLRINAPQLESITCLNTSSDVIGFNQNNIKIDLIGQSVLSFLDTDKNMTSLKAHLEGRSMLDLSHYRKIHSLDVDLKDHSKLLMPVLPIENLTLLAGDSTRIAAPSSLFKLGFKK
jgi:hypothetical protein